VSDLGQALLAQLDSDDLDELADRLADRTAAQVGSGSLAMNMRQAAAACGISTKTLGRAIAVGELPASRVGTRRLILRADLEAWLIARRSAPRPRDPGATSSPTPTPSAGSLRVLYDRGSKRKRPRTAATAGARHQEVSPDAR
jgi:excisionase family DNA binding protein